MCGVFFTRAGRSFIPRGGEEEDGAHVREVDFYPLPPPFFDMEKECFSISLARQGVGSRSSLEMIASFFFLSGRETETSFLFLFLSFPSLWIGVSREDRISLRTFHPSPFILCQLGDDPPGPPPSLLHVGR